MDQKHPHASPTSHGHRRCSSREHSLDVLRASSAPTEPEAGRALKVVVVDGPATKVEVAGAILAPELHADLVSELAALHSERVLVADGARGCVHGRREEVVGLLRGAMLLGLGAREVERRAHRVRVARPESLARALQRPVKELECLGLHLIVHRLITLHDHSTREGLDKLKGRGVLGSQRVLGDGELLAAEGLALRVARGLDEGATDGRGRPEGLVVHGAKDVS
mmetsp:Transcript_10914/g.29605  ORF Transcript_10914/g.29605 Transcript_10914/m.29605 type:complete len:224 (+) Transcript_10914:168-839(+)